MKRFQKFMFSFFVAFSLFVMTVPVVMAEDSEVIEEANYTITYVLSGGVNSTSNPETYDGKTTITLKNPTRTGYTFGGWYSDSSYKKKVTSIKEGSTGNKTLYAKWSVNSYTIKYNSNGGTGKMSNTSTKYNKNVTLTNKFKRTGYTFTGWNTKKDGTGTSYENKEVVKGLVSKNKGTITLYAQWKKNTYTIKYNLNGGNEVSNPTTYTVTTKTITLKNPKRTGYTFQGWYSDSKYKKKVTSIKKGSTGNKTLYAKWTANTYTVKYNSNGGTGKMSNTSVKYNKSVTLTSNKFKRTGYTFTGWNTKKDGTGTSYKNKASIKNLTSKNKGTVTLYAQWKKNTYTIKYNLNGGTNSSSNPTTYTVTTSTITLKNPTSPGYTFKGWYSDSKFKKKISSIKKGSTGNKTLYAKWTANSYKVAFNGNGATKGKMSTVSYKYDTIHRLPENQFSKGGDVFVGWNTKKDGTGTSYSDLQRVANLTYKNGATVTLYAQWKKASYTISYELDGGTNDASNPTYYDKDVNNFELKNPTKTGYTFRGWYLDKDFQNRISYISYQSMMGNKTLYARWEENQYTLRYANTYGGNSSKYLKYNEEIVLETPTKPGYKFVEWNTEEDGTGKSYAAGEKVKQLASSGTFYLYAQWQLVDYHITYELDGGTNDTSNPTTFNANSEITLKNPTKSDYTFQGWYLDKEYTKEVESLPYYDYDYTNYDERYLYDDITLYAKWVKTLTVHSETNITVKDDLKIPLDFYRFSYNDRVLCESSNDEIVICGYDYDYVDGKYNYYVKVEGIMPGTADITIKNKDNTTSYTITVTVPNFWDRLEEITIPESLGAMEYRYSYSDLERLLSLYPKSRLTITKHQFYNKNSGSYDMLLEYKVLELNLTDVPEYTYLYWAVAFYDESNQLIGTTYIDSCENVSYNDSCSKKIPGEVFKTSITVPRKTVKMIFVELPSDVMEQKALWDYSDVFVLTSYLDNVSYNEYSNGYSYDYERDSRDLYQALEIAESSMYNDLVSDWQGYVHDALENLEWAKSFAELRPTIYGEDGKTLVEEIQNVMDIFADVDEFDPNAWEDYRPVLKEKTEKGMEAMNIVHRTVHNQIMLPILEKK